MTTCNIAMLGASGYTGAELIRLLLQHPYARIRALAAHRHAGQPVGEVFPHLAHAGLPDLVALEEMDYSDIDVLFCCLPHATSQPVIRDLPPSLRVIDLSADFRLRDPALYEQWYGQPHQAESLQARAVYGLSEYYGEAIASARLVANPGCYPTCSLLPLLPLLEAQAISPETIIIDAKSGVSGAGRSIRQHLLFNEVAEGMAPYGVNQHRHMAEIKQELLIRSASPVSLSFVPHLIPQRRGMLTSCYVRLEDGVEVNDVRAILHERYASAPFVHLLRDGATPTTHAVRGTNHCHVAVYPGADSRQAIVIAAIDNLGKGASGQAVQNMNLMLGQDVTLGLRCGALFP